MKRCKYRPGWWRDDHRCWKRGWLFGYCTHHFLERLRWEHTSKHLAVRLDLGMVNRPYVMIDEDRPRSYVSLSFGNDGSDPVFMVELRRTVSYPPADGNVEGTPTQGEANG